MKSLPSFVSLVLAALCALTAYGQDTAAGGASSSAPEIVLAPRAPHIVSLTSDSITVVTGSTQVFTVDTPEEQGLVSTAPTASDLARQLRLRDGAAVFVEVVGKDGTPRKDGSVEAGDTLRVSRGEGAAARSFRIETKPSALGGELQIERPTVTVNTARDIVLNFTAGQRSPNATVRVHVPAGVEATLDNTTVNVIGRGTVTLRDLPKQSIGRVGSAYSYSKVGVARIEQAGAAGSVVVLENLDLRPANG